jgi:hypothetical protein
MFLVQFFNFAYTKSFETEERAIEHMKRAGFESSLMDTKGNVLGHFSPFSGFSRNGA